MSKDILFSQIFRGFRLIRNVWVRVLEKPDVVWPSDFRSITILSQLRLGNAPNDLSSKVHCYYVITKLLLFVSP